ncbi:MAG TPA: MlaD family protein [Solirubrobacteraceae bacterium]|nr:MlaD family protein [Solirubrobacteraceae bacterium]
MTGLVRAVARPRVVAAVLALVVIVGLIAYLQRSYTGYSVRVVMADAGGLQSGSNVNINGTTVGSVASLTVNKHSQAVATVHLNSTATPIGRGATAQVQIDGFFGERLLALTRGDYRANPERSGATIPIQNSSVSVRLDDVLNSLDANAQGALRTFLDEQGQALVGRGQDLTAVLAQLPQTLPATTALLNQLSANQQAIGALVDNSSRVVGEVAAQRGQLRQLVNSANGAFSALQTRRTQLGSTVQAAPGTLAQARSTLATLQGAAIPLAPAADGLRASAPALKTALVEIPAFANAAIPTLDEVSTVAPSLQKLADVGTPVVRALEPLTTQLSSYATRALIPITTMLANNGGAQNTFGTMEGWARSTMGYDAAGHDFRFGFTLTSTTIQGLLNDIGVPKSLQGIGALHSHKGPSSTTPSAPSTPSTPAAPAAQNPLKGIGTTIGGIVNGALGATHKTLAAAGAAAAGTVQKATGGLASAGSSLSSLLGYLLKK